MEIKIFKEKIVDFLLENYASFDWKRDGNSFDVFAIVNDYKLILSSGKEGCWLNVLTIPISGCGYTIDANENNKIVDLYNLVWIMINNKKETEFWMNLFGELQTKLLKK